MYTEVNSWVKIKLTPQVISQYSGWFCVQNLSIMSNNKEIVNKDAMKIILRYGITNNRLMEELYIGIKLGCDDNFVQAHLIKRGYKENIIDI